MYQYVRLILCLAAVIVYDAAHGSKLSPKEYERFSGLASQTNSNELLRVRGEGGNPYIKIVRGLLSSNKGNIEQYITEIPCNIIDTLESDADAAKLFVQQIEAGQVPSIITNLPQEAVSVFGDVLNIFTMLPSEIIDIGEAAVTDVVNIVDDIEDNAITAVLASLPSEIVADVTDGWSDLTAGLSNAFQGVKCFFAGCATPTPSCGTPPSAAASTTPINAPATPTNNPAAAYPSSTLQSAVQTAPGSSNQSTAQNGTLPSLAGKSCEWAVGNSLGIAVVGILGIALLL